MNSDQLSSTIRTVLKVGGTILVTLGVVDATSIGVIGDAAFAIIGGALALWGQYLSWKQHA